MARYFDGTNDHISIANDAALDLPDADWTLGGWIKIKSNAGIVYQFLYNRRADNSDYVMWLIGEASVGTYANKLWFYAVDGGEFVSFLSDNTPGQSTDWQHICVVRSSGVYTQYINGAANGTATNADLGAIAQAEPAHLGTRYDFTVPRLFKGDMAEWAKWDSALTSEQIAALVDGVRPPEIGTRPAWYAPLQAGLEEEVAELSLINNGTIAAEHPPKIVPASGPLVARFNRTPIMPDIQAAQMFEGGMTAAQVFGGGMTAGQVFEGGMVAGQVEN